MGICTRARVFARVVTALAAALGVVHLWAIFTFPHGAWVSAALALMVLLCLKCAHRAWNRPAALTQLLVMSALMAMAHMFMALGFHEHQHGGANPTLAVSTAAATMLGIAAAELLISLLCGIGLRLTASGNDRR